MPSRKSVPPKTLYDNNLARQAGLPNAKPLQDFSGYDPKMKDQLCDIIRRIDIVQHNKRYKWFSIPADIDEDRLERLLYQRGDLCLFYYYKTEKFYILPYALCGGKGSGGGIDCYSRYNYVQPLVIGTTGSDDKEQQIFDKDIQLKVVKDVLSQEEEDALTYEDIINSAVLLHDYTPEVYRETIEGRYSTISPLIKMEVEQLLWARTASENSCGTLAAKVPDSNTAAQILNMNEKLYNASIKGDKFLPVETSMVKDMDVMDSKSAAKPQEFLQTYQSLDNLRLKTLGVNTGGVFEKQGTILQAENDQNSQNAKAVLDDGLKLRQRFCMIVNQIFGTHMWCIENDEFQQMIAPKDKEERNPELNASTEAVNAKAQGVAVAGGETNEQVQ